MKVTTVRGGLFDLSEFRFQDMSEKKGKALRAWFREDADTGKRHHFRTQKDDIGLENTCYWNFSL